MTSPADGAVAPAREAFGLQGDLFAGVVKQCRGLVILEGALRERDAGTDGPLLPLHAGRFGNGEPDFGRLDSLPHSRSQTCH